MKKYILILMLTMIGTTAFAQKGMQGFGGNLDFAVSGVTTFGGGIKYQYHISDRDRLEASLAVRSKSDWELAVSNHYFLNGIKRFRPYLITGLAVGAYAVDSWSNYDTDTQSTLNLRLGLGLDCRLSHKWSCQIEPSYNFFVTRPEHDYGFLSIKLGITYNF